MFKEPFIHISSSGRRLQRLTVTVYTENPDVVSDAEGTPCATFEGPAKDEDLVTLQCEGEVSGRYIRITKQKSLKNKLDLLSFCEVEVTGMRKGHASDPHSVSSAVIV